MDEKLVFNMEAIKRLSEFKELPDAKYIGYCWYSDAREAREIDPRGLTMEGNPFVMEGNWYTADGKLAVTYRNSGSGGMLHLVDLSRVLEEEKTILNYLASPGMGKIEKLTFCTIWQRTTDENCEGMQVLMPVKQVLINVKHKDN